MFARRHREPWEHNDGRRHTLSLGRDTTPAHTATGLAPCSASPPLCAMEEWMSGWVEVWKCRSEWVWDRRSMGLKKGALSRQLFSPKG